MSYDFRYLTHVQKSILVAGGWKPGDVVVGGAHHKRPSRRCLEGLIRRCFLIACPKPNEGAYYVPSEVAAAYRDARNKIQRRRMHEDLARIW